MRPGNTCTGPTPGRIEAPCRSNLPHPIELARELGAFGDERIGWERTADLARLLGVLAEEYLPRSGR